MTNVMSRVCVSTVVLLMVLVLALPATAQQEEGADRSRPVAKIAKVYMAEGPQEPLVGELLTLDSESLLLLVNGAEQRLDLKNVARVEVPRDSLKNGAAIGAVVLGAWCAFICGQGLDRQGQLLEAVIVNAGLGALIGMAIDKAHGGPRTLYPSATRSFGLGYRWRF